MASIVWLYMAAVYVTKGNNMTSPAKAALRAVCFDDLEFAPRFEYGEMESPQRGLTVVPPQDGKPVCTHLVTRLHAVIDIGRRNFSRALAIGHVVA